MPVGRANISNSCYIYGLALEYMRGKLPQRKLASVEESRVMVPIRAVVERLKYLTMAVDVFFINKIPFLITMLITKLMIFVY